MSSAAGCANGRSSVMYRLKISRAPDLFGLDTRIFTSKRPGRTRAGSIKSSRFVAPITITLLKLSTPSNSASNCGTTVVSISELTPDPRVRKIDSISSKKTITGRPSPANSLARSKIIRIWRSVSPTNLFNNSGPLTLIKYDRDPSPIRVDNECATALAINVFPQPGGPYNNTPFGGRNAKSRYNSG